MFPDSHTVETMQFRGLTFHKAVLPRRTDRSFFRFLHVRHHVFQTATVLLCYPSSLPPVPVMRELCSRHEWVCVTGVLFMGGSPIFYIL